MISGVKLLPFKSKQKFAAIWLICFSSSIWAASEPVTCPQALNYEAIFTARIATLLEIKAGLQRLFNGDTSKPLIPESLFNVSLQDSAAVSSRVAELQELVKSNSSRSFEKYRNCIQNGSHAEKELAKAEILENAVNQLRLNFLKLPDERRGALLSVYTQVSDQHSSLQSLVSEKKDAEKRSVEAEESLRDAEALAQSASTSDLREIATARALFEKQRKDMADLAVRWTEELETLTKKTSHYSEELSRDASILAHADRSSTVEILNGYFAVTSSWRDLVDLLFSQRDRKHQKAKIPNVPNLSEELIGRKNIPVEEIKTLSDAHKLVMNEASVLTVLRDKINKEENEILYRLLLTSGKLRAQFIGELSSRDESTRLMLDNNYAQDLFREIRLIPYRPLVLLKTYSIETADQLSNGLGGLLALAHRLSILFFFVVAPIASFFVMKRASYKLDNLREWLIRSRLQIPRARSIALWIRRIGPYLPWAILLVAVRLAHLIVKGTELEGVGEIIPYFEYFIFYRIFRLLLSDTVIASSSYYTMHISKAFAPKIEKTARFIGLYLFFAACLLQATHIAARKALFYNLIWETLFYLTPIWLATASYWWHVELSYASRELLPEAVSRRISKLCFNRWSWFVCLPLVALLFSVILIRKIFSELAHLDSAKRVSAQIFRRKLESAAKGRSKEIDKDDLPEEYLAHFELTGLPDSSLVFSPASTPLDPIIEVIERWSMGKSSEHTLAIQGEKGIGKSCLLQRIAKHFTEIESKHIHIPGKITDENALFKFLESELDIHISTDGTLTNISPNPRIVLLDDGQNLFLARRGGFRAFRAFVNLCNLSGHQIFWCMTINRYSWAYLNSVTGGSQHFRHVFHINEWNDDDIKTLILSRHEKTKYHLEFDPIIFAMTQPGESEEAKLMQDRYFELLWDQSNGNPRTALILWLSALEVIGNKKLRVGIPANPPAKPLSGLTDDELFVIAAVIRHENLTAEEAVSVTSLSSGVVRHAFRVGSERGFLEKSETERFRIRPLWQAPLTRSLKNKNFVYG